MELGQGGGITAAERCEHGVLGENRGLGGVVEIRADRIASTTAATRAATAAATFTGQHTSRRLPISLFHRVLELFGIHWSTLPFELCIKKN
jgi:hypothetical protein